MKNWWQESTGAVAATGTPRRTNARVTNVIAVLAVALVVILGATMSSRAAGTFNPSITFETSTTRAAAHPDLRITIDNTNSDESIQAMSVSLPDGFMGSLAAAEKCTDSDPSLPAFGDCDADTKIGTVTNEAIIDDSKVRIKGDVFLATAAPANVNADPASLIIKVLPQVAAVDFEPIILSARVKPRYGDRVPIGAPAGTFGPTGVTGAFGPLKGVDTIVTGIPNTVDDDDNIYDPVSFRINKVTLDLKSRLETMPASAPLLTNPSSCTAGSVAVSYTSSDTSIVDNDSVPYQATDCNDVNFEPTMSTTLSSPNVATTSQLSSEINLPQDTGAGNGTFSRIEVKMPPSVGANFSAFGSFNELSGDMCPGTGITATSSFYPDACPPQAKIGTVTITTPLLDDPVTGDVYLISKLPLPYLAIDVSHSAAHPDTPRGIVLRLVGSTGLPSVDTQCTTGGGDPDTFCQTQISALFQSTPDAPVSSIALNLGMPDNREGTTLSGKPLTLSPASDPQCQGEADVTASLRGWATPTLAGSVPRIQPFTVAGCTLPSSAITSGPVGQTTSDTTPTFEFNDAAPLECAIDTPAPYDDRNPNTQTIFAEACANSFTASTQPLGIHNFFLSGGTKPIMRSFGVRTSTAQESTPPVTTIDTGPADAGTTPTATPEFEFSSNETPSTFDCAVDDGAFLPCTSPFTSPKLTSGVAHTFEVRATDDAGNIDVTAAKRTFTVDVPFDPQIVVTPSTTVARAHPSLDVTITSGSHEDMKDLKLALPDGFFGGLTGVAEICELANADAVPTTCPAASQVGTVDTEAEVVSADGLVPSEVNLPGKVFLTRGRAFGEPAGLMISVHAKVGTVDLGYIQIPARLQVRDHALGIDSAVIDVPKSITSVDGVNEFDLRTVKLSLQTGTGAPYPLLTNPSSCGAAAFTASYVSYDSGSGTKTSSDSAPFQVTGCDALGFSPHLSAKLTDSTTGGPPGNSRSDKIVSATLDAHLSAAPGDAGITSTSILLPKPVTINVLKIPPVCEAVQYETDTCPPISIVGTASAVSPLLPTPLTGNIYLVRAIPPLVVPRLGISLRGAINVNIVAVNRFEPGTGTQIRTTIENLPDVPLSSFTLRVANVISTLNQACDTPPTGWSMIGGFNGFNGKSAPVNAPLEFDCDKIFTSGKYRRKGKRTILSFTATAKGNQPRLKKYRLQLPRGISMNKRALAKKLVVTADGKRLKARCFRYRNATTLDVGLCGKKVSKISLSFRAGSLNAKRVKRPKMRFTATDVQNKSIRSSIPMDGNLSGSMERR